MMKTLSPIRVFTVICSCALLLVSLGLPTVAAASLRTIMFEKNSAEITRQGAAILDEVVSYCHEKNMTVKLDGHTCNLGPDAYNQRLSERRATAVKQYLVERGVPADKIITRGYGESVPMFDNKTNEGRRLNRRVNFYFE